MGANRKVRLAERAATVMSPISASEAPAPAATPWLGGLLCVGGARTVVGVSLTDGHGRAATAVPLRALGFAPGASFYAQALYRDAQGASAANTSSALMLTVAP